MYLSKWTLSGSDFFELTDGNHYKVHQKICRIFNESSVKFDIGFNNGWFNIITQSSGNIIEHPSHGNIVSKLVPIENFTVGKYRVIVNLNAVRQITSVNEKTGKKKRTKIPLVGSEINQWVDARASYWGFTCTDILVNPTKTQVAYKNNNHIKCKSHIVTFTCDVTDQTLFQEMILNGIGSQKSFGYGLVKAFKIS